MLAEDRLSRIVDMVAERGSATVPELASALGISESTIRRDLEKLDQAHRLAKVHGGATCLENAHVTRDLTLSERHGLHDAEKRAIVEYAAALVGPDDFVYVDAGSTTELLVRCALDPRATYVTDAVTHALALVERGCRVVVLGGELKGATEALVGPDALDALARYNFTIGFWGTNGATLEQGLTTPDRFEAQVKRTSMRRTARRYVLADPSKLGRVAPVKFADFRDATIVTTDIGHAAVDSEAYRALNNLVEVSR